MPPKEFHEDFMEILGNESLSYSTVKKMGSREGRERALMMIDSLLAPNMPLLMKMSRTCTPLLCVIGGQRSIASKVGISFGAVLSILTDILGIQRLRRMLTDDQERNRLDISRYLLSHYEDDPNNFIRRVVTQDETWVHHFDPDSKMQSKQWKCPGSGPGSPPS